MKLKTTITVEFEGKIEAVLTAALQRGLLGLHEGITLGAIHTSTGIETESVKISHSKPEISG